MSESPLSVDRLLARVSDPTVGGIALFVGVIRDRDEGADVVSLDYTEHPTRPRTYWPAARVGPPSATTSSGLAVEHRIGHLEVGDLAVVVAVGAVHRGAGAAGLPRT